MKYVLTIFILFSFLSLKGQTVSFNYDGSGNRTGGNLISRSMELLEEEDSDDPFSLRSDEMEWIKVYPNPTQGRVTVELSQLKEPASFYLFSPVGQLLQHRSLNSNFFDLDLTPYPKGNYWLRVKNGMEEQVRQIIRE